MPVQAVTALVHDASQVVPPPPSPTQDTQPNAPADTQPQAACPICKEVYKRWQERDRHMRTFLPHSISCPFLHCDFRCDRYNILAKHWEKRHPNTGQAPELRYCQIYDPEKLVKSVVSGSLTIESAAEMALSQVKMNAPRLGKEKVWAEDWWGRKPKKFKHSKRSGRMRPVVGYERATQPPRRRRQEQADRDLNKIP
jgi:hypothetical protein